MTLTLEDLMVDHTVAWGGADDATYGTLCLTYDVESIMDKIGTNTYVFNWLWSFNSMPPDTWKTSYFRFHWDGMVTYDSETLSAYVHLGVQTASSQSNDDVVSAKLRMSIGTKTVSTSYFDWDLHQTYIMIVEAYDHGDHWHLALMCMKIDPDGQWDYSTIQICYSDEITGYAAGVPPEHMQLYVSNDLCAYKIYEPCYAGLTSANNLSPTGPYLMTVNYSIWGTARKLDYTYYDVTGVKTYLLPPWSFISGSVYDYTLIMMDAIESLEDSIEDLETEVVVLESQVESLETQVDELETQVDDLNEELSDAGLGGYTPGDGPIHTRFDVIKPSWWGEKWLFISRPVDAIIDMMDFLFSGTLIRNVIAKMNDSASSESLFTLEEGT